MAGVEGILSIIKFCFFFGIAVVCIILIATAVLRWINKEKKLRERNLNILAGVAVFVLFIMFLIYSEGKELPESKRFNGESGSTESISPEDQSRVAGVEELVEDNAGSDKQEADSMVATKTQSTVNSGSNTLFFRVSVRAVKSLLFAIIVFSAMALLLMIILGIKGGIGNVLEINEDADNGSENQGADQAKAAQEELQKEEKSDGENTYEKNVGGYNISEKKTEGPGQDRKKSKGEALINNINRPMTVFTIACGLVSLFFLIPFLVGGQTTEAPIESWINGVSAICEVIHLPSENASSVSILYAAMADVNRVTNDIIGKIICGNTKTSNDVLITLVSYMLMYIIIIGGVFTVVKLLCAAIIPSVKKQKKENAWNDCFSCIAILAVGVSVLWLVQKLKFSAGTEYKLIVELLKTYGTVVVAATITIITTEIVRLLLNIRKKYILVQAKCLFIFLIGECTILLLDMLIFIYDAVSSAINGAANDNLAQVKKKLKKKIVDTMKKAIDKSDKEDDKEQDKDERILPQENAIYSFQETVTKKRNVR